MPKFLSGQMGRKGSAFPPDARPRLPRGSPKPRAAAATARLTAASLVSQYPALNGHDAWTTHTNLF